MSRFDDIAKVRMLSESIADELSKCDDQHFHEFMAVWSAVDFSHVPDGKREWFIRVNGRPSWMHPTQSQIDAYLAKYHPKENTMAETPSDLDPATDPKVVEQLRREGQAARQARLHTRVSNDFRYHRPTEQSKPRHERVNELFEALAHEVVDLVPEGRELSLALTELQIARNWANTGIAVNLGG